MIDFTSFRARRAFTLLELLVVLAVIGLLIVFGLPAVQQARASAARARCMNNIKQLATACHNYESEYGSLPPAIEMNPGVDRLHCVSGTGDLNFGPNWLVLVLPYTEQSALYESVADSVDDYYETGDAGWHAIAGTTVKNFLCPADSGADIPYSGAGGWARGNYACNAGGIHDQALVGGKIIKTGWQSTEDGASPTNVGGQVGLPKTLHAGGVMCINWGAPLSLISTEDGTSTTVMLAEVRIGSYLSSLDPRGTWALGFPGASVVCAHYTFDCLTPNGHQNWADDGDGNVNDPDNGMGAYPHNNFQQANSRSRHVGGVVVVMCDGSVRFVKNSVSTPVWWYMNARDDGNVWTDN